MSHLEYLAELTTLECEARREGRIKRLLTRSKLPLGKTWESFRWERLPLAVSRQMELLTDGGFLDRRENVLVFGKPGSGKSHALCALAKPLIVRGRSLLFTTGSLLVQQLLIAKRDLRLPKLIKQLSGFEGLIIDDLGYVQQSREEMEVLFTLLAERYERGWPDHQYPTKSRLCRRFRLRPYAHPLRKRGATKRRDYLPPDQWKALVKDKYPAYVSWEDFEKIADMLRDNRSEYERRMTRGVPRDGKVLLQGIVYCGHCGRKMTIQYKDKSRCTCSHLASNAGEPICQMIWSDMSLLCSEYSRALPPRMPAPGTGERATNSSEDQEA